MSTLPVQQATNANRLALAALLLGGIAIGGSPIFVRLSEVGPMTTAFWRVALAFVPLLIWSKTLPGAKRDARPETFADYFWLSTPGIFLAADLTAWHLALHMTSVANATLFTNLAPIFVTLGSWAIFRARISRIFLIGLGITLIGVFTLKGGPAALGDGKLAGDATAIVAAIFYAAYILAIGRLRARFSTRTIMIWATAVSAICMLPASLIFEPALLPLTLFGWAILVGLALISHAGGQSLIIYALAFLPPAFSSLTLLLQPVVAAALAWFILSEPIGLMQAIGGAIIIFGILIARRG